jgi:hypothetical protein
MAEIVSDIIQPRGGGGGGGMFVGGLWVWELVAVYWLIAMCSGRGGW